jgi:hypothetical protein
LVDTVKMRRPHPFGEGAAPSGRVAHDDRGNAIWTWSEAVDHQEPLRYASSFEISDQADDSRVVMTGSGQHVQVSAKGGYNPYESGFVKAAESPRKRDLRALSKWIEDRRQRGEPTKA